MSKNIQLSLLLVALLSPLQAQNQYILENISVTASQGTTLDKKDVTDSVIVITKEILEESRITNLADALNKLGNIAMTQTGGPGSSASFYTRGMDSKRTLVLIDGIRVNNPASLGIGYSQIMLSNVEQIEIIKGAQSGVWGGDASAGVINIITSKAKKGLHTVANIEYGTYDTLVSSLQTSYKTNAYDILLGGSFFNTDGFSTVEPIASNVNFGKDQEELGLEKDSYTNKSFNAKLGLKLTSNDRLEFNIQSTDATLYFDSSLSTPPYSPSDSNIGHSTTKDYFYSLVYKHKNSTHDVEAQYNVSSFDTNTISTSGQSNTKGSVEETKISDKIQYLNDSFLRVGASYQVFEQIGVTPNVDKKFTASSVFLTNYNKLNIIGDADTIITESIRYDEYNAFDNSLTAKLGLKHFISNDFYISTNIGTGFNTPTLSQLYGQWGANPNLKPEKSLTTDITIGNNTIWLTGFYNKVEDLIEWVGNWSGSYAQVDGTSTFKGIEINYEDFIFNSISIKSMYTYMEATNAKNQILQNRPKHQLDLHAVYYISDNLDFGLNAQYIGKRYDLVDSKGAQTGRYIVLNLMGNIKTSSNTTFYAKLNNITDMHYQTVDGYATADRSVQIGLNAKF